ncbi:hypothetical protein TorRG33x02_156410 [Trema orientale]|uniref:Uncharacterized protein n=1 Tax=Trema orientale TaxID=63057 RepID=A0A2P5ESR4_TREOI|nr:hypothetical protein TorRG33x02_156410 [Trema orientale]
MAVLVFLESNHDSILSLHLSVLRSKSRLRCLNCDKLTMRTFDLDDLGVHCDLDLVRNVHALDDRMVFISAPILGFEGQNWNRKKE